MQVEVQAALGDEPAGQFPQGQPVAHDEWAGPDETLPARSQDAALHRSARRVGTVQDPQRLARGGAGVEQVGKRGDIGVDAGTDVLEVDQQHIEVVQHGGGRITHLPVKAEDRDAVTRIDEISTLHHVVLLVSAHPVLGTEGGRDLQVVQLHQCIQAVTALGGDRGGVAKQGQTPTVQGPAQLPIGEQAIDAELEHGLSLF